jgi:isoaspartyl peptidase/L-asparaginase-like protein (Ntn-hydrolase superfamily)
MNKPSIICHGGAGHTASDQPGVDVATQRGWQILNAGGSALEAVVEAVVIMEDDPVLNAGTGGRYRDDGSLQLDAAVATSDGKLGLIMAIENTPNPVRVAADLLSEDFHILAGRGARQFADLKGHRKASVVGSKSPGATDTVGAVARDNDGNLAVASSTGGCSGRPLGRVGDTPMWGSGLWCDQNIAIAATGIGEDIIKQLLCSKVAVHHHSGTGINNSLSWGIDLFDKNIEIGLIAMTKDSQATATNSVMPVCYFPE